MNEQTVERIRDTVFQTTESSPKNGGSSIEKWFKQAAQGSSAYKVSVNHGRLNNRLIAWKKGTKFEAANLFSRTVDSSRLLPSALADFRIQWYAHKNLWCYLDNKAKVDKSMSRIGWQIYAFSCMLFDLFIMRNMHDYGGADIPVIVTDWSSEQLEAAFAYWAELSKNEWSQEEQLKRFSEVDSDEIPLGAEPCFFQADLLVRALLSDPKVGYVPRFIVFLSKDPMVKARALFMDPSFQPPRALMDTYPTGCDAPECDNTDCALFSHSVCRSLASGTIMVRTKEISQTTVRCNFWPCGEKESEGSTTFSKCQRCKEVLYCSKICQENDWAVHILVCEARA